MAESLRLWVEKARSRVICIKAGVSKMSTQGRVFTEQDT